MKFSVVTSVLNGAAFLSQTIRSVTNQSYAELEYIIIDAGSTDGSVEIAEDAARSDARIRVYHREGEPLYSSILWGLDQATGDVLSWINADDLYTEWAFATIVQYLSQDENAQWLSGFPTCWDAQSRLRFVKPEGWRPQKLIQAGWFHQDLLGYIQQESVFFSRALYEALTQAERDNISSCALAGDFVLWKALAVRQPLVTIPSVLGGFRRHGDNLSVKHAAQYMTEVRAAGGYFPSIPTRMVAQYLYRIVSSVSAARLAIRADGYTYSTH